MRKSKFTPEKFIMVILISVLFTACEKDDGNCAFPTSKSQMRNSSATAACGIPSTFNVVKQYETAILGSVDISNDQNYVYVTITCPGGLNGMRLYYGDCNSIPTNQALYGPLVTPGGQTSYTYTISKDSIDSCACYVARVETNSVGSFSANYCIKPCPDECLISIGDYKTFGPGGYGSKPRGNNPAMYLKNNFSQAFPNGVQIGCNNFVSFTTAQEIMNFLPQGTTTASLNYGAVMPQNKLNVLAAQSLTLALNIGFDNFDPAFGNASGNLQDLVVSAGDFSGITVSQILDESNNVLGGCSSNYSALQILNMVSAINENFEDGIMAGSLLTCP